jgi:hypothetical protein
MQGDTLNNITKKQQELAKRMMDLAVSRVFETLHANLHKDEKIKMEEVFESGSDKDKEKFVKKYIPDFEGAYKKELEKLGQKLGQEIQQ